MSNLTSASVNQIFRRQTKQNNQTTTTTTTTSRAFSSTRKSPPFEAHDSPQTCVANMSSSSNALNIPATELFSRSTPMAPLSHSISSGACPSRCRRVIGPELFARAIRAGAPFSVRISANGNAIAADQLAQGPSCIFVGPVETASQETLEALYHQARDAYYSGKPLIVDDMFDRVELKLRWYGSKCVVKYPRCSLRRQSTYADAEEDLSQVFTLASIWVLFFSVGALACVVPVIYTIRHAYQDAFTSGLSYINQAPVWDFLSPLNSVLFMVFGSLIGYPVASASVKNLHGLWRNDLVALKGVCPNCGEEVFAFVKSDKSNISTHRADCHVCESVIEFRAKAEKSNSRVGRRRWVYGRIYLVSRQNRRHR